MNKDLGKLIFNGVVLFLSISFGLFPSNADKIALNSPILFTILIFSAILLGIFSLILSFFGIKKNNPKMTIAAGICFIFVIIIFAIISFQSYSNAVKEISGLG